MRMKNFIRQGLFVLLVLLAGHSSRAQFSWYQQSSGTTEYIKDVSFITSQEGWAVGSLGLILHTQDGGINWVPQYSGCTTTFHEVFFIDANTGWIAGDAGTIMKTTNGGANWIAQITALTQSLEGVYFVSEQVGWTCGFDGTYGKMFKTIDGGDSWAEQVVSVTTSGLWKMDFVSLMEGWVVGVSGIYHTIDGGDNWSYQVNPSTEIFEAICMVNDQTGWVVGDGGTILATTDGGNNWNSQVSGTTNYLWDVDFADALHGIAAGMQGTVLYTENGGSTWVPATDFGNTFNFLAVDVVNSYTAYLSGEQGAIFKTPADGNDLQVDYYHGLDTVCANVPTPVVITFKNNGTAPIESAYMTILDGTTPILYYYWTGFLAGGSFQDIDLGFVEVDHSGIYKCAFSGDSVTTNNLSSKYIYVVTAPGGTSVSHEMCAGDSVEINAYGSIWYKWFDVGQDSTNATQVVSPPYSRPYYLLRQTEYCSVYDSVMVTVNDCTEPITAISPNGDGVNDFLFIEGISTASNTVIIYNRWGDALMQFTDYDNETVAWDGKGPDGTTLEEGTFYYTFEAPSLGIRQSSWVQIVN
jgi:gliding motility-associated-like protein